MPGPPSPFDYERVSMKWVKVVLTKGSWENALMSASDVCGSSTGACRKFDTFIQSSRSLDLLCTRRYVNVSKRSTILWMRLSVFTQWQMNWRRRCNTRRRNGFPVSDRTHEADVNFVTVLCQTSSLGAAGSQKTLGILR